MSAKVYLAGLAGGLLVSAALIYPAYLWVPYQYLADWKFAGDIPATLLAVLAVLLFVATGVAAARLSGLQTRVQAAGAGAAAGLMAAMLSFLWMVRPAAGVYGAADLLMHGAVPVENDAAYIKMILDAVVGIGWWTNAAFAAWIVLGILLAGLGGLAAGPRGEPDKHWKIYGLPLALTGILVAGLLISVDFASMSMLVATTREAALKNGTPPAFPVEILLFGPLAFDWLVLLFWQVLIWRTLRSRATGAEARARLWTFAGYYSVFFPIAVFFWLLFLAPAWWWVSLMMMAVPALLGLPSLRLARSVQGLPVTEEYAFRGRRWVVFFAILAALFTLSAFTPLVGTALNIVLLVVTMVPAILPAGQAPASQAAVVVVDIVQQNYVAGWNGTGWLVLGADFVAALFMTIVVAFVTYVLPRTRDLLARFSHLQATSRDTTES
jgi:hypothetical protein